MNFKIFCGKFHYLFYEIRTSQEPPQPHLTPLPSPLLPCAATATSTRTSPASRPLRKTQRTSLAAQQHPYPPTPVFLAAIKPAASIARITSPHLSPRMSPCRPPFSPLTSLSLPSSRSSRSSRFAPPLTSLPFPSLAPLLSRLASPFHSPLSPHLSSRLPSLASPSLPSVMRGWENILSLHAACIRLPTRRETTQNNV